MGTGQSVLAALPEQALLHNEDKGFLPGVYLRNIGISCARSCVFLEIIDQWPGQVVSFFLVGFLAYSLFDPQDIG